MNVRISQVLCFISILLVASCISGTQQEVYYKGETNYIRKQEELKLSYKDAEQRYLDYLKQHKLSSNVYCEHHVIVNNSYLFSVVRKKTFLRLEGYYVNGFTGEVNFKGIDPDKPPCHIEKLP